MDPTPTGAKDPRYEARHAYKLVLYENAWTLKVLQERVLLVDQEVAALNVFFCKTGQMKRYLRNKEADEEVASSPSP